MSVLYDVIVVGGGPAGLSAALVLGRSCRRVLVCDSGRPRNAASQALHGFLTRDGIRPAELLRLARDELRQYETVEIRDVEACDAECAKGGFRVTLSGGEICASRKLLLATGVVDHLPAVEGLRELYGRSVFHCPYCDAWELRGQPMAVYGQGPRGLGLSLELTAWTRDLALLSDGPSDLDAVERARLRPHRVALDERPIARLEGRDGRLERVVFKDGTSLPRRALFFTMGQSQRSQLAIRLGCALTDKGAVRTGPYETTHIPGLYVAGDASRAVQWAIVAAAEGAEAAFAINTDLVKDDLAAEAAAADLIDRSGTADRRR
jgi:thioredoxin reductase